jgi:hypothetical protein
MLELNTGNWDFATLAPPYVMKEVLKYCEELGKEKPFTKEDVIKSQAAFAVFEKKRHSQKFVGEAHAGLICT